MKYHITMFWVMLIVFLLNASSAIFYSSQWSLLNAFMAGLLIIPIIDAFRKGYLRESN